MALDQYAIVVVFIVIGLAFLIATLFISRLVRPSSPDASKLSTYECGIEPKGDSWGRFNIRYYIFALLFVLFDVETAFIYPWAVKLGQLKMFAFVEMLIFLVILAVGLIYAWRKGTLEWLD